MPTSNETLLALVLARTLAKCAMALSKDGAAFLEHLRADAQDELRSISGEVFSTDNRQLAVAALEQLFDVAKREMANAVAGKSRVTGGPQGQGR